MAELQYKTSEKIQEQAKEKASESGGKKLRTLSGIPGIGTCILFALLPIIFTIYIVDLPLKLFNWSPYPEQYLALVLALGMPSVFLSFRATRKAPGTKIPWYDYILGIVAFIIFIQLAVKFEDYYFSISLSLPYLYISGFLAVLLTIEAARRLLGLSIALVGVFFVLYTHFCYLVPKPLKASGEPWDILFAAFYAGYDGLMGMPTGVIATMLIGFLVFGAALMATGGGAFLSDLAMSLLGQYRGGAAKGCVAASALFGSISGSPAANVAITGGITIPLMRRTGFTSTYASAVEAVASTGGLILPPIMGIAAFIMAEFLRVPYYQVALAAAIPAILYYVAVFIQVHLDSHRQGVTKIEKKDLPNTRATLKNGWVHFISFGVLIYLLFVERMSPGRASLYATVVIFIVALARSEYRNRNFPLLFWRCLVDTGRQTMMPMAACCVAGLVIGAVSMTNLGSAMTFALTQIAGGSLLVLLCLAALAAIVLGMGMPIAATYILTATLMAPAIIQLGLKPMQAHMFLQYFGMLSFVTPPVCIAVFVAASIGNAPMMASSIRATRLAIVAYLVPFGFAYNPALLGYGSVWEISLAIVIMLVGICFFSIGNAGYLHSVLSPVTRIIFVASGIGMLIPEIWSTIIGFAVGAVLTLICWLRVPRSNPPRNGHMA